MKEYENGAACIQATPFCLWTKASQRQIPGRFAGRFKAYLLRVLYGRGL